MAKAMHSIDKFRRAKAKYSVAGHREAKKRQRKVWRRTAWLCMAMAGSCIAANSKGRDWRDEVSLRNARVGKAT